MDFYEAKKYLNAEDKNYTDEEVMAALSLIKAFVKLDIEQYEAYEKSNSVRESIH